MKIYLLITICIMISLSAISGIMTVPDVGSSSYDIKEEMEKRFIIRDRFKEKGNSGKYIKVSHMQP